MGTTFPHFLQLQRLKGVAVLRHPLPLIGLARNLIRHYGKPHNIKLYIKQNSAKASSTFIHLKLTWVLLLAVYLASAQFTLRFKLGLRFSFFLFVLSFPFFSLSFFHFWHRLFYKDCTI